MEYTKEQILEALKGTHGEARPVEYEAIRELMIDSTASENWLSRFPPVEAVEMACKSGIALGWVARSNLAKAESFLGEVLQAEPQTSFGVFSRMPDGRLQLALFEGKPLVFYSEAAARAYCAIPRDTRFPYRDSLHEFLCPIRPDGTPGEPIESC